MEIEPNGKAGGQNHSSQLIISIRLSLDQIFEL